MEEGPDLALGSPCAGEQPIRWGKLDCEQRLAIETSPRAESLQRSGILSPSCGSHHRSPGVGFGASFSATPPAGLSIECSPRSSPRLQTLSLEVGLSRRGSPHTSNFDEESWKGEILPNFLYLGDRVTASDLDRLKALGITHVLNATEDVSNFFETEGESTRLTYLRCPIKDRSDAAAEMARHFDSCISFLDSCRERGGRALVHCRAGVSRSATLVLGYLMRREGWDLRTAVKYVDNRRFVQPNTGFIEFLISLETSIFGKASMTAADFGFCSAVGGGLVGSR